MGTRRYQTTFLALCRLKSCHLHHDVPVTPHVWSRVAWKQAVKTGRVAAGLALSSSLIIETVAGLPLKSWCSPRLESVAPKHRYRRCLQSIMSPCQ